MVSVKKKTRTRDARASRRALVGALRNLIGQTARSPPLLGHEHAQDSPTGREYQREIWSKRRSTRLVPSFGQGRNAASRMESEPMGTAPCIESRCPNGEVAGGTATAMDNDREESLLVVEKKCEKRPTLSRIKPRRLSHFGLVQGGLRIECTDHTFFPIMRIVTFGQ